MLLTQLTSFSRDYFTYKLLFDCKYLQCTCTGFLLSCYKWTLFFCLNSTIIHGLSLVCRDEEKENRVYRHWLILVMLSTPSSVGNGLPPHPANHESWQELSCCAWNEPRMQARASEVHGKWSRCHSSVMCAACYLKEKNKVKRRNTSAPERQKRSLSRTDLGSNLCVQVNIFKTWSWRLPK